jgi:curved DNA-binding protein CbpA
MAEKTHYEVLSISTTASTDDVRKAYHRLARQHHPDRFRDPAEKKRAEETFTAMTDAFNVLSDSIRRAEYDRSLSQRPQSTGETPLQREAKTYIKGAQLKLQEGDAREAIRMAKAAVHLDAAQSTYWAVLAQALEADRNHGEAARTWEEAIKRAPTNGKLYRLAGQCLEKAGMSIRAKRMYEQAVKIDRFDATSAEALKRLSGDGKDEAKKAGLLGGLFKKS